MVRLVRHKPCRCKSFEAEPLRTRSHVRASQDDAECRRLLRLMGSAFICGLNPERQVKTLRSNRRTTYLPRRESSRVKATTTDDCGVYQSYMPVLECRQAPAREPTLRAFRKSKNPRLDPTPSQQPTSTSFGHISTSGQYRA